MRAVYWAAGVATLLVLGPAQAHEVDAAGIVAAHNAWRAEVGVTEPLRYAKDLAASAQAWANELKRTDRCEMRHSEPKGQYGENLFWASAVRWSDGRVALQPITAQQVVDDWGSERDDYDAARNRCAPGKVCGHYTQVVWRDTREVGCARAICEDTQTQVWVCHYRPAGNWVGRRPY